MPMQVKIWKHSSPVQAACLSEAESGLVAGVGRQLDRGWTWDGFWMVPHHLQYRTCATLREATGRYG